ncbi:MAG TPA: universal stress protein [Streptosporangiaceae bacterium]
MPTRFLPAPGRILVGIDGSPASVAAVRWAGREAQLRGMRVHVVHVRDQQLPIPHYAPQPRASEGVPVTGPGERMNAVVREALGPQPEPGVQLELADGLPARVLIDRSVGAEMLVLGSTSPGNASAGSPAAPPQARTPLGPVARDCLHAAPCPVVVVRSGADGAPAEQAPPAQVHA